MKQILAIVIGLIFSFQVNATNPDPNAFTKVGDKVPSFVIKTLDGKTIDTQKLNGKVLYINFFTLSCPPCMKEMPRINEEIYKAIEDENFICLAIGREHTNDQLQKYKDKKDYSLNIAADTDRSVYKKFAEKMVPRHYIIKDGKIIYQHLGYGETEFNKMIELIKSELKK